MILEICNQKFYNRLLHVANLFVLVINIFNLKKEATMTHLIVHSDKVSYSTCN